jgi:importin subunit alpha-6/7
VCRRTETTIQIRKNKKEERLNQRRKVGVTEEANQVITQVSSPSTNSAIPQQISPALLEEQRQAILGSDPEAQLKAVQQFRRLLSIERNPPIQQVIEAGVVPVLVHFLQRNENPNLQFESAWALTNIASGTSEHTRVVIDAGAVAIFVQLLLSPNEDVREQAAWALGNIAGDSVQCRDLVLGMGALTMLLRVAEVNLFFNLAMLFFLILSSPFVLAHISFFIAVLQ